MPWFDYRCGRHEGNSAPRYAKDRGKRIYLPFLEMPSVVPSRSEICLYGESLDPVITALRHGYKLTSNFFALFGTGANGMGNVPSQGGGDIAPDKFIRFGPLCDACDQWIREGTVDVAGSDTQGRCHGTTYMAMSISSLVRREISWPVPPGIDGHR